MIAAKRTLDVLTRAGASSSRDGLRQDQLAQNRDNHRENQRICVMLACHDLCALERGPRRQFVRSPLVRERRAQHNRSIGNSPRAKRRTRCAAGEKNLEKIFARTTILPRAKRLRVTTGGDRRPFAGA
jgi:hypothetical protein